VRAAFLLHELGRAGGMNVITGHARRLREAHGVDAEIVLTRPADDPPEAVGGVPVRELAAAREVAYDVVIATWWETAEALWELNAGSRALLLQSLEERFYAEHQLFERLGAASVLGLPIHYVAIAGWLSDVVAELRPDALCRVVRNGIDKDVFRASPERAPASADEPLRVLVEGQPDLWFKAVPEAIAAARACSAPVTVTLVAPDGADDATGAERVAGGLDAAGMAALYAEQDVVLKLSRVEGLGLVPLEAMHVGVPAVVTPYTGHEEYMRHGENGLVVGYDDPAGTTAALDRLAGDRALLGRLSRGALATAADWPSAEESTTVLAGVLGELAAAPAPDPGAGLSLLLGRQRLALELGRGQVGRLRWNEQAVADLRAMADELRAEIGPAYRRLDAVQQERAYRAAVRARTLLHRVTGRGE
jgi:glycosyltransferase involved in cell wall biosynthesis